MLRALSAIHGLSAVPDSRNRQLDKACHLVILNEKTIMAVQALDYMQSIRARYQVDDALLLLDREEPIRVDPDNGKRRGDRAKRCLDTSAASADVEQAHRIREGDIRVGVESTGQFLCVVIEIRPDLESASALSIGPQVGVLTRLGSPSESLVELRGTAVGEVGDAPCNTHPCVRALAVWSVVVVTASESGIGVDGRELSLMRTDLIRVDSRSSTENEPRTHSRRVRDEPFEHTHPPERGTEHERP